LRVAITAPACRLYDAARAFDKRSLHLTSPKTAGIDFSVTLERQHVWRCLDGDAIHASAANYRRFVQFLVLLLIAASAVRWARRSVATTHGGCLVSIALGFIGALLGHGWLARSICRSYLRLM
jgi:hypothetical protein